MYEDGTFSPWPGRKASILLTGTQPTPTCIPLLYTCTCTYIIVAWFPCSLHCQLFCMLEFFSNMQKNVGSGDWE